MKNKTIFITLIACVLFLLTVQTCLASESVAVIAESGHTGNIFYSNDEISFKISLLGIEGYISSGLNVACTVKDNDNNIICAENISFSHSSSSFTFKPSVERYGLYILAVSIFDGNNQKICEKNFEFSKVRLNSNLNDKFGICSHYLLSMYSKYENNPNIQLDMIEKAGFGYVRENTSWSVYETNKGEYTFNDVWKEYIEQAIERNVAVLPIFCGSSKYYGNTYPPYSDSDLEAFSNYAADLAAKISGLGVHDYEIWNEYDLSATRIENGEKHIEKAKYYVKMMQLVYAKVKAVDPDSKIIGCVTSGVPEEWLKEVFRLVKEGNKPCFDIISVHPYTSDSVPQSNNSVYNKMLEINTWLKAAGLNQCEVWATEFGWSTYNEGVSEKSQADYLVKAYVIFQENKLAEKMFWYQLSDGKTDVSQKEYNYGMLNTISPDDGTVPLSAKPAYLSASNMNRLLAKHDFKNMKNIGNSTKMYEFVSKSNESIFVLWNTNGSETVSLEVGSEKAIICDLYGNENIVECSDNKVSVDVSDSVIYVRALKETQFVTNYDNMRITMSGYLPNSYAGQILSIMVYTDEKNPSTSMAYFDQIYINDDGTYEITFGVGEAYGTYFSRLSYNTNEVPVEKEFVFGIGINSIVFRAKDFSELESPVISDIWIGEQTNINKDVLAIYASYKDGVLVATDIKEVSVNDAKNSVVSVSSNIDISKSDEVRIFLWDNISGMIPLAKEDVLKKY